MTDQATTSTQQTAGTSQAGNAGETNASAQNSGGQVSSSGATVSSGNAQGSAANSSTQSDVRSGNNSTAQSGSAGAMWGEDWREQYAKADDKKLGILKRYTSPAAALDALFAARQKIDSGELKKPLPANATPEQVTEWRKENGIPEKPEGYLEKLPHGVTVSDELKPGIDSFAKAMHDANMPPEVVHKAIAWQNQWRAQQAEALHQADETLKTSTEDALRAEWGNEYRANINNVHALLNGAPAEVSEALLNARTADGKPFVGTPGAVRWLAGLAKQINPFGTIVPGASGSTGIANVDGRIAEIEKMMSDRSSAYWKGSQSEKIQNEYRELVDARERIKGRAA